MSAVADRSGLGWNVAADEWDRFVADVAERWAEGPDTTPPTETVRFELERAMIEFVDSDAEFTAAEQLLRDYLDVRGLSSSTATVLSRDVDPAAKRQLGHRVRDTVQQRFRAFVDEEFNGGVSAQYATYTDGHTSYGEALTAAITEYRDGGRGQRLKQLVDDLVTGNAGDRASTAVERTRDRASTAVERTRDRASTAVESTGHDETGVSTAAASSITGDSSDADSTVDPETVIEITEALDDEFMDATLREKIKEHAAATHATLPDELVTAYETAVLDAMPVVEHPAKDALYISEDQRAQMTVWDDLTKETRVARLRRLVASQAVDEGASHHAVTYSDVRQLFAENLSHKPSVQYAYDAMENAATAPGFSYGTHHGEKQLRCELSAISDGLRTDLKENWGCSDLEATASPSTVSASTADDATANTPTTPDEPPLGDDTEWVSTVADRLGDVPEDAITEVITACIVREKYATPADFEKEGFCASDDRETELREQVTDDDRQRVYNRLGVDPTPDDGTSATASPSTASPSTADTPTTPDEPTPATGEVEEQFRAMAAGHPGEADD